MKKIKNRINNNKKIIIAFTLCLALMVASLAHITAAINTEVQSAGMKKSDIFIAGKNVTAISDKYQLPLYSQIIGDENNGVLISTKGNEAQFSYNGLIDANTLTNSKDLIAFQALASNEGAIVQRLEIRLTDAEDSSNRIGIVYTPALSGSDPGFNSYTRVLYNNVERGMDNMGKNTIHQNIYGTMGRMQSFYGHNVILGRGQGAANIFRAKFDNNEKAVYVFGVSDNNLVLDLDNPSHVGYGKEWKGFASGLIKLDVIVEYTKDADGGLIVTRLLGKSLNGDISEADKSEPEVRISLDEEYKDNMPPAAVNTPYKLPIAYGFDWYDGAKQTEVNVVNSNNQDVTTDTVKDGYFTPKSTGSYNIKYTRTNSFGKSVSTSLSINVLSKIPNYYVAASSNQKPVLFTYFNVPTINISGGSGKLNKTEKYFYAGKEVLLDSNRRIYIDKPGLFRINIEITGYTGEPYITNISYIIDANEAFFTVRNMPYAITKGVDFLLPDFVMSNSGALVQKKIFADGKEIDVNERKINTDKQPGDTVLIKYQTIYQDKQMEKEFVLKVVSTQNINDFILKEGGISAINLGQLSTKIDITSDGLIRMPFAVAAQDLGIRFDIGTGSEFSSLDIKLIDNLYSEINYFLRLTPYSSTQSFVQVNGVGQKYVISGGFGNETEGFNFNIDNWNGKLRLGNGNDVCDVPVLSGNSAKFEMVFNGVTKSSFINLTQLSNQMFTTIGFSRGDRTEPILSINTNSEDTISIRMEEYFDIYEAAAYDVLSYNSSVSVKLIDPDGDILYNGYSANKQFLVEKKGFYTAIYTATDISGNKFIREIIYKVIDEKAPEIKLSGSLPATVQVGKKLVIPNAVVTDNFDDECELVIMILDNITYSRTVISAGEHTFTQKGSYKIIYSSIDSSYNISRVEYDLFVV